MWICPYSKYVEVIPKVKTSQKTIPKVKNQSREIPPRWFRRWKINLVKSHRDDFEGEYPTDIITKVKNQSREIPPRWFRRWKINLVKSHRDDSEGEYPTDIITKVSKFHQHNSEWWRSVSLESHNQIGLLSQTRGCDNIIKQRKRQ
jgi:predicted GIY-YIG superfamily endonuclease